MAQPERQHTRSVSSVVGVLSSIAIIRPPEDR
jgi:hypothetical protein